MISIASPVMDILYALIIGGTIGVGVLTRQLCGARDWERLRLAHATALLGGSAITVLFSVLGLVFGRRILLAQGNSAEACAQAMLYLTVILVGLICCYLYHYYASLLRAYGDSRTPFIVLLVSSALHALLDVLLIGVFQMGIRGVAYSTVFCQLFSGVWLIRFTHRNIPQLSLGRRELQLDAPATTWECAPSNSSSASRRGSRRRWSCAFRRIWDAEIRRGCSGFTTFPCVWSL